MHLDAAVAFLAQLARRGSVRQVELAVLALDAADRLAGRALGARPLGLLVAGRAGVGAHHALGARTGLAGVDVLDGAAITVVFDLLQAGPAAEVGPGDLDGAVFAWEGRAIELTVREVPIDTLTAAVAATALLRALALVIVALLVVAAVLRLLLVPVAPPRAMATDWGSPSSSCCSTSCHHHRRHHHPTHRISP